MRRVAEREPFKLSFSGLILLQSVIRLQVVLTFLNFYLLSAIESSFPRKRESRVGYTSTLYEE